MPRRRVEACFGRSGHMSDRATTHVLVGVTGSVAAVKVSLLVECLHKDIPGVEVKVVTTERALHFFDKHQLPVPVLSDADEWQMWKAMSDPVLHVELRNWADIAVIAPLDANTLAKLAGGLCDNLLTCVLRAWDVKKPVCVCPAMNTFMWTHPLTQRHLDVVQQELGYNIVQPISKKLACGDIGVGAMAEPQTIAAHVAKLLKR